MLDAVQRKLTQWLGLGANGLEKSDAGVSNPQTDAACCGPGVGDTSFAGASTTRKQLANWQPVRAAADADLLPDLAMLVARSRDLNRNNGVAAGGFQTLGDNVVGTGLRLVSTPDYRALGRDLAWAEEWSSSVESLWKTWAETCACDAAGRLTFPSMTQLVFRSALENGEALALPLWLDRTETPYRTCLQLVETDRLSSPFNAIPTPKFRGGIEMDDYGRPVAYHLRKINTWPGIFFPAYGGWEWERIPAETSWGRKRVLHMLVQERPDQTRGKPILAPVIEQFRMLDSYQRTELQSAIVNSLVAGVIETPLDPNALLETFGGDANKYLESKGQYRVQLEGGSIIPLYPGDKLQPFLPARPAVQFAGFVEAILRQIGAAMSLPYELIMKDFSKTNYSSARAAMNEAWRFFNSRREWLATYWAGPVYRLWLEEAVQAGQVEAPGFYENMALYCRAKWIGPGRGTVDPVKEAQAAQLRIDAGISTLEEECAEQGVDWEEVAEQRALEIERYKELGLPIPAPVTPATRLTTPGEQPAPEDQPPGQQPAQQEAA